jgi:hypothetical protein
MSDTSTKIALALLIFAAAPAASYARTANNVTVDPSGIANTAKVAPLPQPRITVPAVSQFK